MTVVVTGAAGFIGRQVVRHLARGGATVVAVDRLRSAAAPGVHVVTADLLDADDVVSSALRGAEAVVHLAGCPGVRDDREDIELHRTRDNVDATARVLHAVPVHIPLVVASSSSVYGGCRGLRPSTETDALCPLGGYARSKVAVEELCADRVEAGAPITVARPFTVAGEGQRPDMALSRWIAATRVGSPVQVFGSTERRRDVTDVRQVAAALVDLARVGARGAVNVGTGVGPSLADLLDAVEEVLGRRPRLELLPARREEVAATLADTSRLRSLIGWAPRTDLRALVRRQAAVAIAADSASPRREAVLA